jgi:hypothetical protein
MTMVGASSHGSIGAARIFYELAACSTEQCEGASDDDNDRHDQRRDHPRQAEPASKRTERPHLRRGLQAGRSEPESLPGHASKYRRLATRRTALNEAGRSL